MSALIKKPQSINTSQDPALQYLNQREITTAVTPVENSTKKIVYEEVTQVITNVIQVNAPKGANGSIQFNQDGSYIGDSGLQFEPTTDTLTTGNIVANSVQINGNANNFKLNGGANKNVLTTDGTGNLSWADVLPSSSGNAGKFLVTNGVSTQWSSQSYSSFATTNDVTDAINRLVGTAPGILNTLDEIAAVIGDTNNVEYSIVSQLAQKANIADLSEVAFTGNYANLLNKPIISSVGASGDYADLLNKPTIPSSITDLGISDGTVGQVLTTDGEGSYSFTTGLNTNEIVNSDYSVSVSDIGIVTMNTARGGLEFGAQPEEGSPQHLHIMRPASQEGSTDLYFGDDYNYVKLPTQQGVEIGSSLNQGTVNTWRFGTDGDLTLPEGGDIKDSTGTSVLGGGNADTGNIRFNGDYLEGTDDTVRIRSLIVVQTASYNFTPGNGDYLTAVWEGTGITFNDPTQAIYDAIWALTDISTIEIVTVTGNYFTVTYGGSNTPGMPQAPTLFVNETAVDGPIFLEAVNITINQGTESYMEIDGTDFRVDVQDDIRMYANDVFRLINKSTDGSIEIQTNDGEYVWEFQPDGTLILPSNGDIRRNGSSVVFTGNYNDLNDRPSLLYRQTVAPATSKGQSGDQINDIAFDSGFVYYCTIDYTDGVTDIWKRVAFSVDTW